MRTFLILSLLALPYVASAQFPEEVKPGMRVRVWLPRLVVNSRRQNVDSSCAARSNQPMAAYSV